MNLCSLYLPWMLLIHNPVDFRDNLAPECYVYILNCAVTEYVEGLETCNSIRLVNKIGCMDEDGIWFLGLQFDSFTFQDMNSARKMMLQIVDSFLKALNSNERLCPWLLCYPFTEKNVEIRVNFKDNCVYSYPTPGQIKYMSFMDGTITYNIENPRCLGELIKIREESFLFAREAAKYY